MQKKIPDISFNHLQGASGFEIMRLSELFQREKFISHKLHQPHRLNFYQMIYVTKGTGSHTVDFYTFDISMGSLIFISPSQVQAFEEHRSYEGYICLFTEAFINREFASIVDRYIIDHLYFQDIAKALLLQDKSMEDFFTLLHKEFFAMSANQKNGVVVSLLRSILIKSKEHFLDTTLNGERSELFNGFKKLLLAKHSEIHDAQEYASILKVSTLHLNLACKHFTNLTTKAFINRFIILESKRQLVSSTIPIKELSTKMGFLEVTNFVKFFKKHTQQTPKAFRDTQS